MTWQKVRYLTRSACCVRLLPQFTFCVAAIVGDIAPSDNITKEVKNQLEMEAVHKIRHMLGHDTAAGDFTRTQHAVVRGLVLCGGTAHADLEHLMPKLGLCTLHSAESNTPWMW